MTDLEKIKKDYGEQMAHFCRDNFSTILETDGLLYEIISSHFAPSKFLFEDIHKFLYKEYFKNYIYSFITDEAPKIVIDKTPKELLDEAGYILYECKSENDIQSFKKYYLPTERLCTFNGGRLDDCYVFFAVKKDVDEIKRYDFPNPMRQDRYGTSVISIQFSRGDVNYLSIKNRYNHTVDNPDSTFSNDLENIIAGLTKSFEQEYDLNINSNEKNFEMTGYVRANDGRFYKYNMEINNIYYCPNNIIINNGQVITDYQEKERYVFLDYFILDLHEKKIFLYDIAFDGFLYRVKDIEKNEIILDKKTGIREITLKTKTGNVKIKINKESKMISYYDDIALDVCDKFIYYCSSLEEIELEKTKVIGNSFLYFNNFLKKISIPNCEKIKESFLATNNTLKAISFPKVKYIGSCFVNNNIIETIDLPNCLKMGRMCFPASNSVKYLHLPKIKHIGSSFFAFNKCLLEISAPNLLDVGDCFLYNCVSLKKIFAPKLIKVGDEFLERNKNATEIIMPNIEVFGKAAFKYNNAAEELSFPSLKVIGEDFFLANKVAKKVYMPNVETIEGSFMPLNSSIEELVLGDNTKSKII